jgi:hypothetical protein
MSLRAIDEVVAWRSDSRGRPIAFEGARERRRIGRLTRILLPGLDSDFAAPGDLVRLYRLPIPGAPIAGMVNFTRRVAAVVPPYRRLAAAFPCWAVACAADLGWALDGRAILAGLVAALPMIIGFRLVAHHAAAATDEASAYKVQVYWHLARHRLAPDRPRRAEPPIEPPDWPARLAASYARALPSHEWHEVARLPVPDGQLIACDPYDIGEEERTSTVEVPPGTYAVVLAIGLFGPETSGLSEARVTHAWVALNDRAIARWEPVSDAKGGKRLVGVDSGLASFSAAASAPALRAAHDDGSPCAFTTRLETVLEEKMRLPAGGRGLWGLVEADEARVVVFESGYGDGLYGLYLGLDQEGELAAVAIDFKVAESIYFAQ